MNIPVILAHPREGSFNHALARTAADALAGMGHTVVFHDLYREKFDPLLTPDELRKGHALSPVIEQHCREIVAADGIVIVHPNWWGQPPAILTGWIDRVLRVGVAYRFQEGDAGEGIPEGLLKIRQAVVLNTSDTPQTREQKIFGDPLETIWKNCVFGFCGVSQVYRATYGVMVTSTGNRRAQWLGHARETVISLFPKEKTHG